MVYVEPTFKRFSASPSTWMMCKGIFLAYAVLAISLAPGARAQWRVENDAEVCVTGTANTSLDIAVCSRALGSPATQGVTRASLLTARARAFLKTGHAEQAIADLDAALALNPLSADAHHQRALARGRLGEHHRAMEDFQRAIFLSPRFSAAFRDRGIARFRVADFDCAGVDFDAAIALHENDAVSHAFRGLVGYVNGRFAAAAGDFRRAEDLGLAWRYLGLWRYLTGIRAHLPARGGLEDHYADLLPSEWPRPLVATYLEHASIDSALVAAETTHPQLRRRRVSETHYYLAALELVRGHEARASSRLRKVVESADPLMPERVLAEQELAHLEKDSRGFVAEKPAC